MNMACRNFCDTSISRRHLLKVGGMGMLGLNMPGLLRAADVGGGPRPRAKRVIFLFQFGGPSHIDLFDMKPNAPDAYRGPLKEISTNVPGLKICEQLPEVAKRIDRFTLIRSMTHKMKNHNSASYYAITGHAPPTDDQRLRDSLDLYPAYGSVVDKLRPNRDEMPTFVSYPHVISDGSPTPGQHASFLGKAHDPLFFREDPNKQDFKLPELSLPANLTIEQLLRRRELQKVIDRQSRLMDASVEARGFDAYYERALAMLNSRRVREAFDLSKEPEKIRQRYGRTQYGQCCLLARRLVESGVKFVTVYFSQSIGGKSKTAGGWDTHGFNNTRMFPIVEAYQHPITDQTLPALIDDLEDRGLLDETLVIWMGEFGRTPKINGNVSRDHWPQCYTALLAGGGVKRGFVYGASDETASFPIERPVRPDDLAATMYHLLGIDPKTEVHDLLDRPLPITNGEPVLDLVG